MLLFGKKWLRRSDTEPYPRFELCKQTIYSENKHKNFVYLIEWFHYQAEFTTAFECMSTEEMNKCLFFFLRLSKKARRKLLQKS